MLRAFWNDDSGQDMGEYALLLALVALIVLLAVVMFRDAVQARFQETAKTIKDAK